MTRRMAGVSVTFGTFTMSLRPDTSSQSPSNPTSRFTSSFLGWFGDLQDEMLRSHGRINLLTSTRER